MNEVIDRWKDQLAERLKTLRETRMVTQADLARMARVSQSTIAQVETGLKLPSLDSLFRIIYALKANPNQLFGDLG